MAELTLIERAEILKSNSMPGYVKDVITELIEEVKKFQISADGRYLGTINKYREELQRALKIAQDPFKAPEQTVETSREIMLACWDMQIEYAAMLRLAEEKRKSDD